MSNLMLLVFGTNQSNNTPYDIILQFINNQNVNIIEQKEKKNITFEYSLQKGDPTKIKTIFIKEIIGKKPYYDKADAYIIFVDLESVESLDKLNQITQFILECNYSIPAFILGHYKNNNDKIQSLNSETMNKQLKKYKKLNYNYDEICIEQKKIFNEIFEINLKKCYDFKNKNKNKKIKSIEQDEANSNCFIY
jgi:Ni,Fe-hydrogenase I large subunit